MVKSLREYLDEVEGVVDSWNRNRSRKNAIAWYRGHEDERWTLSPTLLRRPYVKKARDHEKAFSLEFKARAQQYLSFRPANDLEWMMIAQHHSVPTRLLDWTDNAAIALYFAVRPSARRSRNGAVLLVDPYWLGDKVSGERIIVPTDNEEVQKIAGLGYNGSPLQAPIPLFPDRIISRMVNQHACFTLHDWEDSDDLEWLRAANTDSPSPFKAIVIEKGAKHDIISELARIGISEGSVFPDLDGLARELLQRVGRRRRMPANQ
jgi:hypothetical protein